MFIPKSIWVIVFIFLLNLQRFGQCVLWSLSGVLRQTRESTKNFELNPFLIHRCKLSKCTSLWNHLSVASLILTTGKLSMDTYNSLVLLPGHG